MPDFPKCIWVFDDSDESWNGDCGVKWALNEGTPAENGMYYCPSCGRILKVKKPRK